MTWKYIGPDVYVAGHYTVRKESTEWKSYYGCLLLAVTKSVELAKAACTDDKKKNFDDIEKLKEVYLGLK